MAIQKYSDYINEEKKKKETVLPTATKQNTGIQKYSDYIKTSQTDEDRIREKMEKLKKPSNNENVIGTAKYLGGKALSGGLSVPEGIADLGASVLKGVGWLTSKIVDNPVGEFIFGKDAGKIENNVFYQIGDQMVQDEIAGDLSKAVSDKYQNNSYVKDDSVWSSVAEGAGQVAGLIATGNFIGATELFPTGTKSKVFNTIAQELNSPTTQTMFLSTSGNGYTSALKDGASETDAVIYGLLEGAKETATEMMYGGLGSAFGKGALDDVVKDAITSKIKNEIGKKAVNLGISMTAEGIEEVAATLLEPFVKYVYKHDLDFGEYDSILQDFVGGALVSGVVQGGQITVDKLLNSTTKSTNQNTNENQIVELNSNVNNIQQEEKNGVNISAKQKSNVDNMVVTSEVSNIENEIDTLKELRKETESKKEQNKIDSQIKELQNQLTTIQNQIEDTNTQYNIVEQQTNVNNVENHANKVNLPGIDNNINKVSLPGIENNINAEPNNGSFNLKQQQLDIINNSNPMTDDYHTGIRSIDDIKTFEEVVNDDESFVWGDYSRDDALRDLQKGTVTVYSSKPIENGNFVSTSKNQARDYAGGKQAQIYSKEVPIQDVAWINGDEGQYARVQPNIPYNIQQIKGNIPIYKELLNKYNNVNELMNTEINNYDGKVHVKDVSQINELKNVNLANMDQTSIYHLATNIFDKYNNTNTFENDGNKIVVSHTDIKESINNIYNGNQKKYLKEHLQVFSDLGDIIESATLSSQSIEAKKEIQKSHRGNKVWSYYLNGLKINSDTYLFEFDVVSRENGENHYRVQRMQKTGTSTGNAVKNNITPDSEVPVSTKDNTTNLPKSQKVILPINNNMQQSESNIQKPVLPSKRVQNELDEMEGLKAANDAFGLNEEETKRLETLSKKYNKDYVTKKKFESAEKKVLTQATKEAKNNLGLTAKESKKFKEKLQKLTKNTKEELMNELAKKDVKKIISDYSERTITHEDSDIAEVKKRIRNQNIKVSDYLKNQITDYSDFKKSNFGKLKLTKTGIPIDTFYAELVDAYPGYFDADIISDADILETLADFMNKDTAIEETIKLPKDEINEIADKVYNKILDNSLTLDEIDNIDKEIYERINKKTRKDVQEQLLEEMGITTDDLQVGKDITSLDFQRTDPIRVNEKVFGYKTGNKINDATIRQTKHNEAERTRFLNKERAEIKDLGIKARSKESAAVQKYGEKQYITDKGTIKPYGDIELMAEFPNAATRDKIKNAAKEIRRKYDTYIDQINNVITEMGYDAIPKRKDYFRHFQEIGDKLSQWGIPLNADSLSKDTLPTDINGVTDQFKPGKNWFASAMQRKGIKTTYDAITGIDGYLEGASNLIYHTEDIQRYRTLSKLVRDTYGQTHGLDNISLDTKEGQQRLNDIFDNKLSKYAAWLDEQANALAGKKGTIDRGVERALGRRIYNILDTAKKQVGSNMTGFNVRSALTNFASAVQGASKTNKLAWIKGTISTMQNIIHDDGLINKSDFLTSRLKNSDTLSKKLWQKASNAGQIFMTGTDYFTSNQIWRSKYYENLSKGMNETQAIKNADDFAARIMGDRSKGSTAEIFNSKTLGLLTQFQLEVNNQWSSIIHDNKMDIKSGNKSGATVMFQLGQLAAMSYLFNNLMRSLTGSDVMIDPIDLLKKIFGKDDDEDKTLEERAREAFGDLLDDVPFASIMNGGRIPISEAFKGGETLLKYATGQKDKYGNDIKLEDVKRDLIESGYYWILPTGYGQIKKTTKGLSMYDKNLPVAGSYTDSGNLRFKADDSTAGKVKAVLFGQYSSKEAQKYIESGYKTVSQSHIKEMQDLDMSSSEYVKYRNKLGSAGTTNNEKINYVVNSNYTDKQKNIMAKNILNKSEDKYLTSSQITDNYYDYAKWSTDISELRKNTSNDKEETINYINELPLSIPQKALFIKTYYKSFKQYDTEIIKYIVGQDLTLEEKSSILLSLGYTIKNGRVYTK